jgi:hypothetical protein
MIYEEMSDNYEVVSWETIKAELAKISAGKRGTTTVGRLRDGQAEWKEVQS